jgi:hypothetical protein
MIRQISSESGWALFSEIAAAERISADTADRLAEAESEQRRAAQAARAALEALSRTREARAA